MALLGNLTGSSQFFNDTEFYNGAVSSSLRMQDARLTETPGSTGNSKKWTFSCFGMFCFKRMCNKKSFNKSNAK